MAGDKKGGSAPSVETGIDTAVDSLQAILFLTAESHQGEGTSGSRAGIPRDVTPRAPRSLSPEERAQFDALSSRLKHLRQLQAWIKDDPDLFQMVDLSIGQQVKSASRRQARLSALYAAVSLVAGWLLSAITPASALAHLLGLGR